MALKEAIKCVKDPDRKPTTIIYEGRMYRSDNVQDMADLRAVLKSFGKTTSTKGNYEPPKRYFQVK